MPPPKNAPATLHIGERRCPSILSPSPPAVFCDDPELERHWGTLWLNRHLAQRHGLVLDALPGKTSAPAERAKKAGAVDVALELLGRHAVLIGASGSGKTRLTLRLLREQLQAGRSALVLDFKAATVRETLAIAQEAGLQADQISLVWTGNAREGVPGWNPFAVETHQVGEAVRAFKDIFASAYKDAWGPRMDDVLENAATVIAGQGLSVLELVRFLQSPDYNAGLMARTRGTPAWDAFPEQHEYFLTEFAALSDGERGKFVAPVLNKIRKLLTIPYLRALLCARHDTLDLEGLWKRPRLVAVHLDEGALGNDGTRLLAGMLAHHMYNICMRKPGPVPVVLCLDELGTQERFLGDAIRNIVEKARQQGLWLMGAGQHFAQISDELRALLLSSTAFQAYFRLGPEDARKVGTFLATGTGDRPTRIGLGVTRSARLGAEYETVQMPVTDAWDVPLKVPESDFKAMQYPLPDNFAAVQAWARERGVARVYVRLPDGSGCELGRFLTQAQPFLVQASPLRLGVRFPRPTVRIEERESESQRGAALTRLLATLPVREAVIRTDTGLCAHVLVAAMPEPATLPDAQTFFRGQSAEEVRETDRERQAEIARLSQGGGPPPVGRKPAAGRKPRPAMPPSDLPIEPEVADDGSL